MRSDEGQLDDCIRNISSRGMLLQATHAPECGTYVEIIRPRYSVTARVAWSKGGQFGIHSRETIDFSELLERRGPSRASIGKPPLVQIEKLRPPPPIRDTGETSRSLSSLIQYGVLAAVGTAAVIAIGATVYATLAGVVIRITSNLS